MAIGAGGVNFLDEGDDRGRGPAGCPSAPTPPDHVRRTDGFPHCPDLVVNSTFWEDFEEVAAFEELVGSHGGMGGTQSHPLVLHPADLPWPEEEVVGAESVHRIFRGWLAGLGHDAYADSEVASPGSSTRTST